MATVKLEPNDNFIIEHHPHPHHTLPTHVPLRATQAPKRMKGMMGVFRINPFAIHTAHADLAPISWQPGPLDQEPVMLEFQLDLLHWCDDDTNDNTIDTNDIPRHTAEDLPLDILFSPQYTDHWDPQPDFQFHTDFPQDHQSFPTTIQTSVNDLGLYSTTNFDSTPSPTTMACMVLTPIHTPPLSSSEDSSESTSEDMVVPSADIEPCALLRRQNPPLHLDQGYFEQQSCYRMYHDYHHHHHHPYLRSISSQQIQNDYLNPSTSAYYSTPTSNSSTRSSSHAYPCTTY
ncbi:hypothetical protein Ac2012v2_006670 [Leucoagaricus gongylophorus]